MPKSITELMRDFPSYEMALEEDEGLFRNGVVQTRIALTPRAGENKRQDWFVAGVLPYGAEVQVVFAGRRAAAAKRLRHTLTLAWRTALADAKRKGEAAPDPSTVHLPISVEGGWRAVFSRDEDGCETRKYQFIAARWTYLDAQGVVDVAGERVLSDNTVDLSAMPPVPARKPAMRPDQAFVNAH